MSLTFLHTGDYGDIIASLPVVRAMGGGRFVLAPHIRRNDRPREQMTENRAKFLIPLIQKQPYIEECVWMPDGSLDHDFDFSTVRQHPKDRGESLVDWHAKVVGLSDIDLSPWIHVPREEHGQIVVNRTNRYRNAMFPWGWIFNRLAGKAIFVGTKDEHDQIQRQYRSTIPHFVAQDGLALASKIAGAPRFIGNQSFCCWLAMAIGTPVYQESFRPIPDSRIERPGSLFVGDSRQGKQMTDELSRL